MAGVNSGGLFGGDDSALLRNFVETTGATFPIGWDRNRSYSQFRTPGAISPFPVDVIVDKNGGIAYVNNEYDPAAMMEVVERLLNQ